MIKKKTRSSLSKTTVSKPTKASVPASVPAQAVPWTEFEGVCSKFGVIDWLQRFERGLILIGLDTKDAVAADLFGTLMIKAARPWYQSQSEVKKKSFPELKIALLQRFRVRDKDTQLPEDRMAKFEAHLVPSLSIKDTQPKSAYWDWLNQLRDFANRIPEKEVTRSVLADKARKALPTALRKELGTKCHSIDLLVQACKDYPVRHYEKLLKDQRQRHTDENKIRF